jgi:hypothetical protein
VFRSAPQKQLPRAGEGWTCGETIEPNGASESPQCNHGDMATARSLEGPCDRVPSGERCDVPSLVCKAIGSVVGKHRRISPLQSVLDHFEAHGGGNGSRRRDFRKLEHGTPRSVNEREAIEEFPVRRRHHWMNLALPRLSRWFPPGPHVRTTELARIVTPWESGYAHALRDRRETELAKGPF